MKNLNLTVVFLAKNREELRTKILEQANRHANKVILLFSETKSLTENTEPYLVVRHALDNDFAAHRNIALENVSTDWTLFLDSDEIPELGFWKALDEELKEPKFEAYFIKRQTKFLGRVLLHGETGSSQFLRLAKTSLGENAWYRSVHEIWQPRTTKIGLFSKIIIHEQAGSISDFLRKLDWYTTLELQTRRRSKAQAIIEFFIFPPAKFIQNYLLKLGFLDGFPGLALAFLMSLHSAELRVKLYEKARR